MPGTIWKVSSMKANRGTFAGALGENQSFSMAFLLIFSWFDLGFWDCCVLRFLVVVLFGMVLGCFFLLGVVCYFSFYLSWCTRDSQTAKIYQHPPICQNDLDINTKAPLIKTQKMSTKQPLAACAKAGPTHWEGKQLKGRRNSLVTWMAFFGTGVLKIWEFLVLVMLFVVLGCFFIDICGTVSLYFWASLVLVYCSITL